MHIIRQHLQQVFKYTSSDIVTNCVQHTLLFNVHGLHCALAKRGTEYCNRSCLWVCACVFVRMWICYHDNSKFRASILTKLDL